MRIEEYLRTSFDDADREYVDGEIVERNWGELEHSIAHAKLIGLFHEAGRRTSLFVYPSLRVKVAPTRVRIPDLSVYAEQDPQENVPTVPPYVAIEILSPEDRFSSMMVKLDDYRRWGVRFIWLVDPQSRKFLSMTKTDCVKRECSC